MPYANPETRRQKRREKYQATPIEERTAKERERYANGKKERMADWYKDTKEKRLAYRRDYYAKNTEKIRAQALARYHKDPEQKIRSHLKTRYGITPEERDSMLAAQGYSCAICKTSSPGKKEWHVDHCHSTGIIRGILCFKCNTGLGNFSDDTTSLQSAIDYLKRHHHAPSSSKSET